MAVLSLELLQSTMEFGIWQHTLSDTSNHEHTMSCPFLRGDKKAFFYPQIDQFCFLIINNKLHF